MEKLVGEFMDRVCLPTCNSTSATPFPPLSTTLPTIANFPIPPPLLSAPTPYVEHVTSFDGVDTLVWGRGGDNQTEVG
jgi:hypothetical protein